MTNQKNKVQVSVFQQPKKENVFCGDRYFYKNTDEGFICALVDGLGSGEEAQESADIVIRIIKKNVDVTVEDLVKRCNEQLMGKRGVVLGILKINFPEKMYTFSSIGNIGVMTVTETEKKRSIPSAGYLAGYKRKIKVVSEKLEPQMIFFMFSDGVLDKELSQSYFIDSDISKVTEVYAALSKEKRDDDTTLIAIRYDKFI
ncbi:SpoIIE family protein phosphatase [Virgibacillus sp. W0430]|uniref:SpoIIE family protein phosphatase n=1 Tax=Virgibacillus sp. W0430 TaxID=3391580 RepID=UPI003F480DD5